MKITHFNSDDIEFKFIKKINRQLESSFNTIDQQMYKQFTEIKEFMAFLHERKKSADIIILTSHGYSDSLIGLRRGRPFRTMKAEQTFLFENDLVLAIACDTANEFGKSAIQNKAQTYIGFNDNILSFFKFENKENEKIAKSLQIIFRKVYKKSFHISFEKFIKKCLTSQEFVLLWELLFKKEVSRICKLTTQQIRKEFSVRINAKSRKTFVSILKLEFISQYNNLNNRLTLIGDPNFVAWHFVDKLNEGELNELLEKTNHISEKNNYYKHFLEMIIHKCLKDEANCLASKELLQNCLSEKEGSFELPIKYLEIAN